MESESLYNAIEKSLHKNGLNLYGVWDKIAYDAKMLTCENLIKSGEWKNLPPMILEYAEEYLELVV